MPSGMNDEMEPTSENEGKSLDLVQRLTVSVLVGGIVGFVASVLALYVASRGRTDLPRDSQLGLWAMTGVIGLLGAAGVLLARRDPQTGAVTALHRLMHIGETGVIAGLLTAKNGFNLIGQVVEHGVGNVLKLQLSQ